VSHHRKAGQNQDIKIANILSENVSQLKYLEVTVTIINLIQEEIKRSLNSGNACCHSLQNLLSSCLLQKNVEIRICMITSLLEVLLIINSKNKVKTTWVIIKSVTKAKSSKSTIT
jgi:hypothetical protein